MTAAVLLLPIATWVYEKEGDGVMQVCGIVDFVGYH